MKKILIGYQNFIQNFFNWNCQKILSCTNFSSDVDGLNYTHLLC